MLLQLKGFQQKRKGQYLIVEDVLLFGVGIALLAGIAATFVIFNDSLIEKTKESQYNELGNLIITSAQIYKTLETKGQIYIKAPSTIAGDTYEIVAFKEDDKDVVIVGVNTEYEVKMNVPLPIRGKFSSSERILLEYDGSIVSLRGTGV